MSEVYDQEFKEVVENYLNKSGFVARVYSHADSLIKDIVSQANELESFQALGKKRKYAIDMVVLAACTELTKHFDATVKALQRKTDECLIGPISRGKYRVVSDKNML